MRIAVDTNILISGLLLKSSRISSMMESILTEHTLVLSSYVIDELKYVAKKKFPAKAAAIERLLSYMSYELVYTPEETDDSIFFIRDAKDYPVLYSAMLADADILITGDKDFSDLDVERPEILTPSEFREKYG